MSLSGSCVVALIATKEFGVVMAGLVTMVIEVVWVFSTMGEELECSLELGCFDTI